MIFRRPYRRGRRPGGGRCQSFPPDGWRGAAGPPAGNAGGDDHRSHGERAALKEPQPAGVRRSAPQHVQRDDIDEAFLPYARLRHHLLATSRTLRAFTGFDRLGSFNCQALAWRVFGKDLVEDAAAQVADTLQGWGYHPSERAALGFGTVLIQSMLVNRSPLLEDMTSEALARIRADPSTARHHSRGYFHGMHRAISALGHARPPPAPLHGVMPEIEGVPRHGLT